MSELAMDRISAGNNLSIDMQQGHWRLLTNGDGEERVLVEAKPGEPLRYIPSFGTQRRLPTSGALETADVDRVVLGWSNSDESWQLGLMLKPALAELRGSRWCGLASWPDPDTGVYRDLAAQAGEQLSQQISRPFTLIPPRANSAPTATAVPAYVPLYPPMTTPSVQTYTPISLELPLKIDQWTLRRTDDPAILELKLSSAWGRSRLLRVVWYLLWTAAFIILSVTTLSRGIALPQPEFLPYAGLASAVFLVLLSIATLIGVVRRTKRILIDGRARTVRGLSGNKPRWTHSGDQLQGVYVSQVVPRAGRRRKNRQPGYGEINLHGLDGEFYQLIAQSQSDEKLALPQDVPPEVLNSEQVVPLSSDNAQTKLQAAGLLIAQTLQLPAAYDQRIK